MPKGVGGRACSACSPAQLRGRGGRGSGYHGYQAEMLFCEALGGMLGATACTLSFHSFPALGCPVPFLYGICTGVNGYQATNLGFSSPFA